MKDRDVKPFPKSWMMFPVAKLERLAIMTVDDEMSDEEALRIVNEDEGCQG